MTKQHMGVAPTTFQVVYVLAECDSSFAPCVFSQPLLQDTLHYLRVEASTLVSLKMNGQTLCF